MSEDLSLLDPFVEDVRPYARFDRAGQIYGDGKQPVGFTRRQQEQGAFIVEGDAGYDLKTRVYQNFADQAPDGIWSLKPRPALEATFDRLTLPPYEEARIQNLQKGSITFTGPVSSAKPIEHPGGVFEIGWTLPGTYIVTITAFPCLPATFTFTVSKS